MQFKAVDNGTISVLAPIMLHILGGKAAILFSRHLNTDPTFLVTSPWNVRATLFSLEAVVERAYRTYRIISSTKDVDFYGKDTGQI